MDNEQAYLHWVGTKHLATSRALFEEAAELGLSRRMPNRVTAIMLMRTGRSIFLVHDEGKRRQCLACAEMMLCPTCRAVVSEAVDPEICSTCKGLGSVERGSGGYAMVDGERWTYQRYIKLRRMPYHIFWKQEHEIGKISLCEKCTGRGVIPQGMIVGFFVPKIEYVASNKDKAVFRDELEKSGIRVLTHREANKGGPRAEGRRDHGFYAVSSPDESEQVPVVERMVECGHVSRDNICIVRGAVQFLDPIPYIGRQFRGLKRIDLRLGESVSSALERVA